jgi:hypothetical protein
VVVPHDWRTVDFFRVAERAGAVITHLNVDEENLERLFLRITEKG